MMAEVEVLGGLVDALEELEALQAEEAEEEGVLLPLLLPVTAPEAPEAR